MCLFGHIHATPWIVPDWSHLAFTEECAYLGTPGMMPVTVPIWAQVRDAVGPTTVPKLVNAEDDLARASNRTGTDNQRLRHLDQGPRRSRTPPNAFQTGRIDWSPREPPLPSDVVGRSVDRYRGTTRCALVGVVLTVLIAGCSSSGAGTGRRAAASTSAPSSPAPSSPAASASNPPTTTVRPTVPPEAFATTDAQLDDRVQAAALPGGTIRIVADDGTVLHEHTVGSVTATTPLDVASSSKWLTAATLMTFVDRGAIALDDDVSRWIPELAGSDPPIRVRQLLDHTSGVRDNNCQNGGVPLAACVATLASSPREFAAGSAFSYGNSPYLVVGRMIEVLGGADFATVVHERLTGPLGMTDTTWPGVPGAANPAFGARTTVDDYGKFLAMVLHGGLAGRARVLSAAAVREITRNQVAAYDTTHDYSVGITQIPRYGLGCWIDVVGPGAATQVVSGNGGKGFYPWVDFTTRTWGIVGLQDDRGAEVAVPASQVVELQARAALIP